jgi:multidrug efflux system membrane fusion protein
MRLLLDVKKNATTVPVAALQTGTQGQFVFVVKPDKTVEVRPVKVGFTEGNTASIDQGLTVGELVVTDGQDKLQPGSRVEVQQQGNGHNRQASQGASHPSAPTPGAPETPAAAAGHS